MVQRPEDNEHRGLLAWWAKNSVAANLLMIIALIGGISGFFSMQRENNVAANFAGATISVAWPGASRDEEKYVLEYNGFLVSVVETVGEGQVPHEPRAAVPGPQSLLTTLRLG